MKIILIIMSSFVFAASKKTPAVIELGSELIKKSEPSDWRALSQENTIYMELESGRVIIELAPEFAPRHVDNIKKMIKNKYWDGLVIYRSQDNYVAQWGDPNEDGSAVVKEKLKGVKKTLPAEFEVSSKNIKPFFKLPDLDTYADEVGFFNGYPVGRDTKGDKSWLAHCYGAVGVSRDVDINSGNGSSLYVVTGHSPRHLDRNITLVGRVISGMEYFSTLPRGEANMGFFKSKKEYIPIKSVRMQSDVKKEKRALIEILRTDTELFKKYVETRRNRKESWFHRPAGSVELCNVPRLTRAMSFK